VGWFSAAICRWADGRSTENGPTGRTSRNGSC